MLGCLNDMYSVDLEKSLINPLGIVALLNLKPDLKEYLPESSIVYQVDEWFNKDIYGFVSPYDALKLLEFADSPYNESLQKFIFNRVIPFIRENRIQIDVLPKSETTVTTMSSLEIAELVGKLHKNIMRDISKLINELGNELKIELVKYKDKKGEMRDCYNLDRESALLLTSGYSAQLRLKIIRRLDELESGKITPPKLELITTDRPSTQLAIPQSLPEALRLAATLAEETEHLKQENVQLNKTKMLIRDKQLASAMGTAGAMTKKVKALEAKLNASTQSPEYQYATVLAIQSRLKHLKVSGLKLTYYCNRNGMVIKDIPDDRYGVVHSYPAEAWRDVYQIDINNVLNKVA